MSARCIYMSTNGDVFEHELVQKPYFFLLTFCFCNLILCTIVLKQPRDPKISLILKIFFFLTLLLFTPLICLL